MIFGTLGRNLWKWLPYTGVLLLLVGMSGVLLAFQRVRLPNFQNENNSQYPAGANDKTEWAFARLRYNGIYSGGFGRVGINYIVYGMTH